MKCGSCRAVKADSYTRITTGHNLFNILVKLNPRFTYNEKNSYFCGSCITSASNKLQEIASSISEQNANSLSINKSNTSDSSKDDYDMIVSQRAVFSDTGTPLLPHPNLNRIRSERKRIAEKENRPCPKRFKKSKLPNISEHVTSATSKNSVSSSQSISTSQSETEVLLNVQQVDSPDSSEAVVGSDTNEKSDSSEVLIQQTERSNVVAQIRKSEKSDDDNVSVQRKQPGTANAESSVASFGRRDSRQQAGSSDTSNAASGSRVSVQKRSIGNTDPTTSSNTVAVVRGSHVLYDSNSSSNEDIQQPWGDTEQLVVVEIENELNVPSSDSELLTVLAAPSAPTVKNPRIRESNSNVPGNLRRYFEVNQQVLDVNNYSRSLAG